MTKVQRRWLIALWVEVIVLVALFASWGLVDGDSVAAKAIAVVGICLGWVALFTFAFGATA